MPEIADVEGFKRYASRYVEGRTVRGLRVRDPSVLRNVSRRALARALEGRRLGHPSRHGKWLVLPVGDEGRLVLHFGMTGRLEWTGADRHEDRFDRVVFELDEGELRYHTQRKLGGVYWTRGELIEVSGALGPDAARIGAKELSGRLLERRGSIKSALMDQKLVAGIGNELSDEILWHARIRPTAPVRSLSGRRRGILASAVRRVLRESMKHGKIPEGAGWLKAVRGKDRPRCPRCGGPIATARVAGRRSYFCPRCQE